MILNVPHTVSNLWEYAAYDESLKTYALGLADIKESHQFSTQ